ncbi:Phenoloxidase-activating factor 3 [Amphibalanus amphitrite]|uniref:Phenoloxidase-activating factor 3 n=1 Tax=Amphibalanus amphitrite TaxID=1232801 RepID=A0A6A4X5F2_AMPAM|nr:phenoloxidase-activating factor 3-like [Amphibalanus amphitrite]KAF0311234.1 Phenoloxidase-activating factor 3 [Amphibalanus amphitrite]
MEVLRRRVTVVVCLALVAIAAGQKLSLKERRTAVFDSLANHPGLKFLDLEFCGTGSEAQISRGPLGCGFPVVGDHPWLVALGFRAPGGRITYTCAGALISDQFVVTSARCALGGHDFPLAKVRLGEYDFGTSSDCLWYAPEQCLQSQEIDTADVMVHPKFKPSLWRAGASLYDIGIVRLAKPVVLTYGILPICLPIYSERPPPRSQRAIGFSLESSAPMTDSGAACCNCSRDRGATSHVMDAVRLSHFNETYDGPDACRYRMLGEKAGEPGTCIGAGDGCMADRGGPMVSADKFGSAYFLLGVATSVPSEKSCSARKDAEVVYLPVKPHTEWLLSSMDLIAGGSPRPF